MMHVLQVLSMLWVSTTFHCRLSYPPKREDLSGKIGVLEGYHNKNRLIVSSTLYTTSKIPIQCSALIHLGSGQNLIHPDLVKKCNISLFQLDPPISILANPEG